jgi:hypothetical protein
MVGMRPLPRIQCSVAVLNLAAFLAVLLSIVVLALAGKNDAAILTGLVGVLGSFRPWTQPDHASGKLDDRVNVAPVDPQSQGEK